jgi:hypothetical protein
MLDFDWTPVFKHPTPGPYEMKRIRSTSKKYGFTSPTKIMLKIMEETEGMNPDTDGSRTGAPKPREPPENIPMGNFGKMWVNLCSKMVQDVRPMYEDFKPGKEEEETN